MLKSSIHLLESNLRTILQSLNDEKELTRFNHEQIIKEQREENANLKETMRVKMREYRDVRALS
jgi:hypothetical protein